MGKFENVLKIQQDPLKFLHRKRRHTLSVSDACTQIPQLSPLANSVVHRCSKILHLTIEELQRQFDGDLSESIDQLVIYARNLLEFCTYKALHSLSKRQDFLDENDFSRLTFDAMLAWEAPHMDIGNHLKENLNSTPEVEDSSSMFYKSSTNMAIQVDEAKTACREAFVRVAPVCFVVADIITVHNLFDALTSTSSHRLHFLVYDKYLRSLHKMIKVARSVPRSLISNLHLADGEIVLDVDGTVPVHPVIQHIGISAWPGRLTLTNHALYFEAMRVGLHDKPVRYNLSDDAKQVIKPELTGPFGARLFDRAVMYSSAHVPEPVYFEFPEFKGNSRREYWLDISLEILQAHKFIRKHSFSGTQKKEVLAATALCVLRYRAIREAFRFFSSSYRTLLAFKLADCLPRGYKILEIFSKHIAGVGVSSVPIAVLTLHQLGILFRNDVVFEEGESVVGHLSVGEINAMELAVKQSFVGVERTAAAQATVDRVKVEGIDTNVAVLKELLNPVIEFSRHFQSLFLWDDPLKSTLFVALSCYLIIRGWIQYFVPLVLGSCAIFMYSRKHFKRRKPLETFAVKGPPNKNPVEQLVTLQEAISQLEGIIQTANISLLKIRAIVFALFPQATEKVAIMLALVAAIVAFVPGRLIILTIFFEVFTREMPFRKESSDRWLRRIREWWLEVPAAPVHLIKNDDKKKKNL